MGPLTSLRTTQPKRNKPSGKVEIEMTAPLLWSPKTTEERDYYNALFQKAEATGSGRLAGQAAVYFFTKSRLNNDVLKQVWDIADYGKRRFLQQDEFCVAMRLIAMAQASSDRHLTADRVKIEAAMPLPMPRMEGAPPPPAGLMCQGAFWGQGTGTQGDLYSGYAMSPEEKSKYDGLFLTNDKNKDGFLTGQEAAAVFSMSGLPRQTLPELVPFYPQQLRHVWELSDVTKDNKLSREEFCVGMHLLVCISKKHLPVPPALPPSLAALLAGASMLPVPPPLSVGGPPPIPPLSPTVGLETSKAPSTSPSNALSTLSVDLPVASSLPTSSGAPHAEPNSTVQPPSSQDHVSKAMDSLVLSTAGGGMQRRLSTASSNSGSSPPGTGFGDTDLPSASAGSLLGFARTAAAVHNQGMEAQRSSLENFRQLLQALQDEKMSLGSAIKTSEEEYSSNEVQLKEMEKEVKTLQSELSHLRQQYQEEQRNVAELRGRMSEATSERKSLLADIASHREALLTLQGDKKTLVKEDEISTETNAALSDHAASLGVCDESLPQPTGPKHTSLGTEDSSPPQPYFVAPVQATYIPPSQEGLAEVGKASGTPPPMPMKVHGETLDPFADAAEDSLAPKNVDGSISVFGGLSNAHQNQGEADGITQAHVNDFDAFPPTSNEFESDPFSGGGGAGDDPFATGEDKFHKTAKGSDGFDAFPSTSDVSFDAFDDKRDAFGENKD